MGGKPGLPSPGLSTTTKESAMAAKGKKQEHQLASMSELAKQVKQNLTAQEKESRLFQQKVKGADGKETTITRRFSVAQIEELVELPGYESYAQVAKDVARMSNKDVMTKTKLFGVGTQPPTTTEHKVNSDTKCVVVPYIHTVFGDTTQKMFGRYSNEVVIIAKDAATAEKAMKSLVDAKVATNKA